MSDRSEVFFNGYGPESRPCDITAKVHQNLWLLLHNQGDELRAVVDRDPQQPLGPLADITEPFADPEVPRILMVGPPGKTLRERAGKLGVWALSESVDDLPFPLSKPSAPEDRPHETLVAAIQKKLDPYYGPKSMPGDVPESVRTWLVQSLVDAGFSEVCSFTLSRFLELGESSRYTDRVTGMSEVIEMVVGPRKVRTSNPAEISVWALHQDYERARGISHVDTEHGYSMDTLPAHVPWDEKLALVKNLVARNFVPATGILGRHINTLLKEGERTVADLLHLEGSGRPHLRADRVEGAVQEGDYVLGPMPQTDRDELGRAYRTLTEGEAVCLWRHVKRGPGKTKSTEEKRLARLQYALRRGNIQPQE